MKSRIETLSQFGRNAGGGVDRVAYSEADLAGRAYIIGEMKKLALDVTTDTAGNIHGKREGTEPGLDPILQRGHSSPQEFTAPLDMARGAQVLCRTVMKLNKQAFE